MKILMVLTSHGELGDTGRRTGYWLEELAAPYYVFTDAGAEVTLASPAGGEPPLDPESAREDNQTEATRRFAADAGAQAKLADTVKLWQVKADEYEAVFYPGGHGPLWDLVDDADSIRLIESCMEAGKPVAAVCHGPIVLVNARDGEGRPIVSGRRVTSFSNSEEAAVRLSDVVPCLVEDVLTERGGRYSKADDFAGHAVRDGSLVTGQNPASSAEAARLVLQALA